MKNLPFERFCIMTSVVLLFACGGGGGGGGDTKSNLDVFIGQGKAIYNSVAATSAASVVIAN